MLVLKVKFPFCSHKILFIIWTLFPLYLRRTRNMIPVRTSEDDEVPMEDIHSWDRVCSQPAIAAESSRLNGDQDRGARSSDVIVIRKCNGWHDVASVICTFPRIWTSPFSDRISRNLWSNIWTAHEEILGPGTVNLLLQQVVLFSTLQDKPKTDIQ